MSRQSHIFGLDDHFFVILPFPFSICGKKPLPSQGVVLYRADLIFRQRGDHMSGSGFCFLINTTESRISLPVLVDYLGSVQCFCHIELGGRA